jgi:hypothetical protein
MNIPTWKVTVRIPVYRNGRCLFKTDVIEAHTGAEAEAIAIEKHSPTVPHSPKVTAWRCERLSGYANGRV